MSSVKEMEMVMVLFGLNGEKIKKHMFGDTIQQSMSEVVKLVVVKILKFYYWQIFYKSLNRSGTIMFRKLQDVHDSA